MPLLREPAAEFWKRNRKIMKKNQIPKNLITCNMVTGILNFATNRMGSHSPVIEKKKKLEAGGAFSQQGLKMGEHFKMLQFCHLMLAHCNFEWRCVRSLLTLPNPESFPLSR
jgi:hypothetical protein